MYHKLFRYSLLDPEIKILILCRQRKELSVQYMEIINKILGEFSTITFLDLINHKNDNIYQLAKQNNVINFTF